MAKTWLAAYHPYGGDGGARGNYLYLFAHKAARDSWVAADPEHREATAATAPDARRLLRALRSGGWPAPAEDASRTCTCGSDLRECRAPGPRRDRCAHRGPHAWVCVACGRALPTAQRLGPYRSTREA